MHPYLSPIAGITDRIAVGNTRTLYRAMDGQAVGLYDSEECTFWFVTKDEFYDMQGDKAWQWNEWELRSLEAAEDDAAWKEEIRQFWDGHLPFFLSLDGGYAYYTFSVEGGCVVYGVEPEFEECDTVADSFEDFMEKVMSGRIHNSNDNLYVVYYNCYEFMAAFVVFPGFCLNILPEPLCEVCN